MYTGIVYDVVVVVFYVLASCSCESSILGHLKKEALENTIQGGEFKKINKMFINSEGLIRI